MKKLLAGCLVLALGACGSKSDAPAAAGSAAAGGDPSAAASETPGSRSGRIDPNAFHKRPRAGGTGGDPASAAAAETGGSGGAPGSDAPHLDDRMKALDTDGDGKISDAERQAGRVKRATEMHAKFDANGDGKLSLEELEANPMMTRMMKRDPDALKAIDANHDGDISPEELASIMGAMRDHRRGSWGDRKNAIAPAPAGSGSTP